MNSLDSLRRGGLCGCVGVWVCGCVGVWVCECVCACTCECQALCAIPYGTCALGEDGGSAPTKEGVGIHSVHIMKERRTCGASLSDVCRVGTG